MSLSNLNNVHLTDAQVKEATDLVANLEKVFEVLKVQLTPADRMKYGSINEQNKLLVNKVYDYANNSPALRCPELDWEEFFRDYKSRATLEALIEHLSALVLKLQNAKTLHDYDNFQEALADYAYTNYRAGFGDAEFEKKSKELKQFFNRTRKNAEATPQTVGNAAE